MRHAIDPASFGQRERFLEFVTELPAKVVLGHMQDNLGLAVGVGGFGHGPRIVFVRSDSERKLLRFCGWLGRVDPAVGDA